MLVMGTSSLTGEIYVGEGTMIGEDFVKWDRKRKVTSDAVKCVAAHMLHQCKDDTEISYITSTADGKRVVKLTLEVLS